MPGTLPLEITSQTVLPVIAAPMFLVSGPELVLAACKAGIIGSFPAPNTRTSEQLDDWMQRITAELTAARLAEPHRRIAPWAANVITHSSYKRLQADLDLITRHRPPLVITALGSPAPVIEAVHAYGGLVFADVNSIAYARKCRQVDVDGLILVCSGAGGHTGSLSPFTFVDAVREFWDGPIVLAGGIANGRAIRAAQVLGADLVYMGTRFIATRESLASDGYKQMLVESTVEDILTTSAFTGANANMLVPSIHRAGLDPEQLQPRHIIDFDSPHSHVKPWKDIWSAGQCVGSIKSVQTVDQLVSDLRREYAQACADEQRTNPWAASYSQGEPPQGGDVQNREVTQTMALRNDMVNFAMETQQNPYLIGKYSPIDTEITQDCLEIIGEIPHDLNGVYVRNGPNPRFQPKGRYHWFDGDGMLHSVHIHEGQVTYRNRWIRTAAFERESAAGEAIWTGVMEPLTNNPKGAPLKDNANTDLVFHNCQLLALWYLAGKPYKIDPLTLETLGAEDFDGKLRNNMSAHAKVDERSGEMMFFDYGPRPPYMTYGVVSAAGSLINYVPIDLPGARMPHDMAITERHSILMDLPLFANEEALRHGRHKIDFHSDIPSRFGILPRYGDNATIRWFEARPCYLYHTINAWEEGDEIILDACRVKRPDMSQDNGSGRLERMLAYLRLDACLYRWRFNMRTGAVKEGPLDDENTEFPTINTWRLGLPSRYSFNVHISSEPTLLFDGLVKYDTLSGRSDTHWFGPGRYGSEAPFAARPNATDEDDGYLLTFVYDERDNISELLIIDARDITAEPVARVRIPQRVPIGFHACWVPGEKLAQSI